MLLVVKEETEIEIDKNLRYLANCFAWKTLFSFIFLSVGLTSLHNQQAESLNEMRLDQKEPVSFNENK